MGRNVKYTKEDLIKILKSVNKPNVSKQDIDHNPNIECGSMTIIRYFGSWKKAIEASELKPGLKGRPKKKVESRKSEIGGYINKKSWKSFLGKMAKNIIEADDYAQWNVGNKKSLVIFSDNVDFKEHLPFKFYYFTEKQMELVKDYNVSKNLIRSSCFDLKKLLNFSGKSYRGIRNKLNRCSNLNLEILDNYKSIDDIKQFSNYWSDNYSTKYFRDFSARNVIFYERGYHNDCINVFIYYNNLLVAYGTAFDGVYVLGKALYNPNFNGIISLSEFLDFEIYKRIYESGNDYVNIGYSSTKGLKEYKEKFPGYFEIKEYLGEIK